MAIPPSSKYITILLCCKHKKCIRNYAVYTVTVSYTHLDVYKRQIGACGIAVRMIAPFVSDKLSDSPVAVSYTHLDVYKRQESREQFIRRSMEGFDRMMSDILKRSEKKDVYKRQERA